MISIYDLSKYTSILNVRITKIYFISGVVHIETKLNKKNTYQLCDELVIKHLFHVDKVYQYGNRYILVLYGASFMDAVEKEIIQ